MIRTPACIFFLVVIVPAHVYAQEVSFDFAYVGNIGNAPDPLTDKGAVAYGYSISKFEVTNAQYVEFLNAVAATDNFGGVEPTLYNTMMASDGRGGIVRSGSPGNYTYSVKRNFGNKPVNFVSFYDAMRFTNWLHNGQGDGDTEAGAYTIENNFIETRSPGAKYWIPSEDEWYKAAYHQPASQGGDTDDYWAYPTASNIEPLSALSNSTGDISNPGANVANYGAGAEWGGEVGNVTTVGSAGLLSSSFYGTFDQAGNVAEWNDGPGISVLRFLGGGGFTSITAASDLSTEGILIFDFPFRENAQFGFRVASYIPEPSTLLMLALLSPLLISRERCSRTQARGKYLCVRISSG